MKERFIGILERRVKKDKETCLIEWEWDSANHFDIQWKFLYEKDGEHGAIHCAECDRVVELTEPNVGTCSIVQSDGTYVFFVLCGCKHKDRWILQHTHRAKPSQLSLFSLAALAIVKDGENNSWKTWKEEKIVPDEIFEELKFYDEYKERAHTSEALTTPEVALTTRPRDP